MCTVGAGAVVIEFEIFHFVCCSSIAYCDYCTENAKARQNAAVKQHNQLDIATKGIYSNKLVSRGRPACMSGSGRQEVAFID
jgi:hypothetical protein